MTEKELHKLRRNDLLELLVAQAKETAKIQAQLAEKTEEAKQLLASNEKFKSRLNEKDAQIDKLVGRLKEKDENIEKFKRRLAEKDALLEKLTRRLDRKDVQNRKLVKYIDEFSADRIMEMEGDISIDEVTRRLNIVFEAAQRAVNRYLSDIPGANLQKNETEAEEAE